MIVVADIGGTRMRIGCADDDGTLSGVVIFDTPQVYEEGFEHFRIYKAALTASVSAVSIGIAGYIPPDDPLKSIFPHLKGWEGKPIQHDLESIFDTPCYIENDTYMGTLGEAIAGAGKGADVVAYVAPGTGIGGRRVVRGEIDDQALRSIGHLKLAIDGVEKEFEEFVSGSAIIRDQGIRPGQLHDTAIWDIYARYFAYGMREVLVAWKPDRVVLGGYLPNDERMSIKSIEKHLRELSPDSLPLFVYAALPYSGLTGAFLYAKRKGV